MVPLSYTGAMVPRAPTSRWVLCAAAMLPCLVAGPSAGGAQVGAVPAPAWARSAEIVDDGAVVYREPRAGAPRRGTVASGTRLAVRRRVAGDGCSTGFWVEIDDGAFVCEQRVRYASLPPAGVAQPPMRSGRILPYAYAFVGTDGTRAYAHPSDYDADQYVEAFGEGFGLIVAGHQTYAGIPFARTRRGLWVERESLRFVGGSGFQGVVLAEGEGLDLAWVTARGASALNQVNGRAVRRVGHREVVHVAEEPTRSTVRLTDGTFMRARDLARARPAPRPEGVGPTERWIDVDVDQQVLVAYEGDRPVFATLVSSGRALRTHETPVGEFRIWIKLATSNMDDLERQDVSSNYSIEGVPWVQYFEGSNGFHAAFWHDDFGRRRSHGCVNLSPQDARWLFDFTLPVLPAGWYAILPTDQDPGTLVRVRSDGR